MSLLTQMQQRFTQDHFAVAQGIAIDSVLPGAIATCSVVPQHTHLNSMGTVQGGLIFTLADFTFAVAANSAHPDTMTLNATIHYLNAAGPDKLYAIAAPKSPGKKVTVYEVIVTDEQNRDIALVTITGYTKPRKA